MEEGIKKAVKQGVRYSGVPGILRVTSQITKQSIKKSRLAGSKISLLKGATLQALMDRKMAT